MSARSFAELEVRCIAPFEAGVGADVSDLVPPVVVRDAGTMRARDNLYHDPDGDFALGFGVFGKGQSETIMVVLNDPDDHCGAAFTGWIRDATKSKRYGRWAGQARGVSMVYSHDWRSPVMVCVSHAPSRTNGPREFYLYETPFNPPYPRVAR